VLVLLGMPAILALTLLVPFAFRRLWPGGVARPRLFFAVTLTLALVVAAVAIAWFAQALVGIGIAGASAGTADGGAPLDAQLRNRLLMAAVFALVAQYWICRGTHHFLGR
jgi:hypothetical protein